MKEKGKRICIFTQRYLNKIVSRCVIYEFENTIFNIDDADIIGIGEESTFSAYRYSCDTLDLKLSNPVIKALSPNPLRISPKKQELRKDYDVFFASLMSLSDLQTLDFLKGWKSKCKKLVCHVSEIWSEGLEARTGELKALSQFDYVFCSCYYTVELLQRLINKPCYYLPPGIDAVTFCPYPNPPERSVDVFYVGRRSQEIHQQLTKLSDENNLFYLYDTINNLETNDTVEHRKLLSNIIKRSKYFVVNTAKFDRPNEISGQSEIGFRFFEGAAAGSVMIGNYLIGDVFKKYFDWTDALINIPEKSSISDFLKELDEQVQRTDTIRFNNVVNMLKYHDWLHRWDTILDIIGEKPHYISDKRRGELNALINSLRG